MDQWPPSIKGKGPWVAPWSPVARGRDRTTALERPKTRSPRRSTQDGRAPRGRDGRFPRIESPARTAKGACVRRGPPSTVDTHVTSSGGRGKSLVSVPGPYRGKTDLYQNFRRGLRGL